MISKQNEMEGKYGIWSIKKKKKRAKISKSDLKKKKTNINLFYCTTKEFILFFILIEMLMIMLSSNFLILNFISKSNVQLNFILNFI